MSSFRLIPSEKSYQLFFIAAFSDVRIVLDNIFIAGAVAAVTLDIGGNAFAPGLAYVAVSRCRSLEGLRLHSRIRPTDIKVDPHAWQFYLSQNSK